MIGQPNLPGWEDSGKALKETKVERPKTKA